MQTIERVWMTSGSAVASIIPREHIEVILQKELEPKAIRCMNLLLVSLCILVEYDDGWMFYVLQQLGTVLRRSIATLLNVTKYLVLSFLIHLGTRLH